MSCENPFDNPDIAARYENWYHSTGQMAANQEKRLIQAIISQFDGVHTILDVGCGTGYFTNWYKQLDLVPFGLDRSIHMLGEGLRTHPVDCCQGDASELPFDSNAFDLLSYITTLEFLTQPDQALKEGVRVARKGLILGVINRHSLLGWRYRHKGGPTWDNARFYTVWELVQLLRSVISNPYKIFWRTTLWPLFPGALKLPWGGFIGLGVIYTK